MFLAYAQGRFGGLSVSFTLERLFVYWSELC
jgi:hypothetical protein